MKYILSIIAVVILGSCATIKNNINHNYEAKKSGSYLNVKHGVK